MHTDIASFPLTLFGYRRAMIHETFRAADAAPLPVASAPRRTLVSWRRAFVPLALLLSIVPLLWPTVPPLIDLLNSMSRYRIALDYASSPYFHQWFDFHWAIVGNLGVDLLVAALAPFAGLEPATKLAVMTIPLVTVAGMALVAREIHGRVPLTAALGFLFVYNHGFNFGFVNFCLAVGLAFLAFGLWLRLGRLGHPRLRMAALGASGLVVWLAHTVGWGMLGVMIFPAALMERRMAGGTWPRAFTGAILDCTPLLLALVPMLAWTSGGSFSAYVAPHFSLTRKFVLLVLAMKNDIGWMDMGGVWLVFSITIFAIIRPDMRFDPRLTGSGLAMLATFVAMPDDFLGSGFIDLRIAPYALALLALSMRPVAETRFTRIAGLVALAALVGRTAYVAADYVRLDSLYQRQFAALDHIPQGSRVFGLAKIDCIADWNGRRMDHMNRMAIVRRNAFTNGTWPPTTGSGLVVHPDMVRGYRDLDSQKLLPAECRFGTTHDLKGALAGLPRDGYDYLWMIDLPARDWPREPWLKPVWSGRDTILYRILHTPPASSARPA